MPLTTSNVQLNPWVAAQVIEEPPPCEVVASPQERAEWQVRSPLHQISRVIQLKDLTTKKREVIKWSPARQAPPPHPFRPSATPAVAGWKMCLKQRNSQLMYFSSSAIVQCEEVKPETPVYILQYKQGTVTVLCEPHSHCLYALSLFVWSALTHIASAQLAQFLQQRP